jgi:excisionase family DNA binding protein
MPAVLPGEGFPPVTLPSGRGEMTDDEIMTLEEVAAYLKLKPQTIYTWAQEKKIPAAKLGKEWRFKKSIIDRWINQHFDPRFSELVNGPEKKGKQRAPDY